MDLSGTCDKIEGMSSVYSAKITDTTAGGHLLVHIAVSVSAGDCGVRFAAASTLQRTVLREEYVLAWLILAGPGNGQRVFSHG